MNTANTLQSNNTDWGFFGGIREVAKPETAWTIAMDAITAATGCSQAGARDFLDSRHGRHFADDTINEMAAGKSLASAIDATIDRWMKWAISSRLERESGIPHGLPYLTGLVTHIEILDDIKA